MNWKLSYQAWRYMYGSFEKWTLNQEADGKFTVECLDILLADPTVDNITITRLVPPDPNQLRSVDGVVSE